ncbi:aminoglycoside phosphotransferase family protein [Pseudonocardia kujensis]|uniref:aminoglycoside phosphotransferase family protein n=1 Tax=Pseudonocardia kujensis TaxID=1128675 RepID=UPI001E2D57AA|nr:aminoglycoside phosphotransferase family protein [Pseudonocardia kujensis]MCE0766952.1 aminoglycoside phosphotransferase family protein [Pseudonocardia kujensis]
MIARAPSTTEIEVARTLLPGLDPDGATTIPSGSHDVVLLPGRAAVRIARSRPAAEALPRRTALLARLQDAGLPFAVPEPLTPVVTGRGWTAVAVSWLPGSYPSPEDGEPRTLRALLDALAAVDLGPLADVLDVPHAYAGRERWEGLMLDEAVPRLPPELRRSGRRRVREALALEPVPPVLVHGDLTGENLHCAADGRVLGVLDWDLASPTDPAIDAACLAHWYGWPTLRRAVDRATYDRARTWYATLSVEQIVKALLDGAGAREMEECVARVARWMTSDDMP